MARNTILLRGMAREQRGIATNAAIPPGSLVTMSGSGDGWALQGAAAHAPIAVARELHELGGNDVADNIPQNSEFTVLLPEMGAIVLLRAAGTIARGDEITTAASGEVDVRSAGDPLVGVANGPDEDGFVPVIIGGALPLESA